MHPCAVMVILVSGCLSRKIGCGVNDVGDGDGAASKSISRTRRSNSG